MNKILQGFGIPYSALLSIIFGMMILSFPIGVYLVFNTEIGEEINFDFPIWSLDFIEEFAGFPVQIEFELGDIFILCWCTFLVLFSICIIGPKKNFMNTLIPILSEGKFFENSNYMVPIITWFSVLILVSGIINFAQENLEIVTTPPEIQNELIQFFEITISPITEEFGFRVLLIGLPLYAMYSHKTSVKHFFKSLWNPNANLHIHEKRNVIILIVIVGVFFGMAHILLGENWSNGKFAQAAASGIIIGWVYTRHGLAPAILIHWATNYFVFSYAYLVAEINQISLLDSFSHSLMSSLEIILLISGGFSVAVLILNYYYSKKYEGVNHYDIIDV